MSDLVEVRAVVRLQMLERVVSSLKQSGVPRLMVSRVHAIGAGVDEARAKLSLEEGSAYADKALVECICAAERAPELVALVTRTARTGQRGDGIVSVHPVLDVIKVRTGGRGVAALE